MSAATIPGRVRVTCFLVIAAVTIFLPIATIGAVLLHPGLVKPHIGEQPPPATVFNSTEQKIRRRQHLMHTTPPLIRCYCDMPQCLAANDGDPICYTRRGCFSRVQTKPSKLTRPSFKKFNERLVNTTHNGSYGCVHLLPTNLQNCSKMFKLTEDSEFPALTSVNSSKTVHAYQCCQKDMCNNRKDPAINPIRDVPISKIQLDSLFDLVPKFQSLIRSPKPSRSVRDTIRELPRPGSGTEKTTSPSKPVAECARGLSESTSMCVSSNQTMADEKDIKKVLSDMLKFMIALHDTEKNPVHSKENVTLDEIYAFMKTLNISKSDYFVKANPADVFMKRARNKRSMKSIKGTVAKERLFANSGLFTSIDFKSPTLNDTAKNPVHSKENVTLGESAFMKTLNISKSDYFVKANPADVFMKRARNKRPINGKVAKELLKYLFANSGLFTSTDFKSPTLNDTAKNPVHSKENVTLDEIYAFMKTLNISKSDYFVKANPADVFMKRARNKRSMKSIKGTVAKEHLFANSGLFTSIDFKSPTLNDTAKNPVHSKENVTLGESAFMKTLNISKSDYFVKANPADVFMKRARNKRPINGKVAKELLKYLFANSGLFTSTDFKSPTLNDTAKNPVHSKENVTLGESAFMKTLNISKSDYFVKANPADVFMKRARNKRSMKSIKGTVAKEYLFDNSGLYTSIDFQIPALNNTAKNPVHSKENVTLGESAFMKTLNISKSDYFVKANPADVFMKRARNKRSMKSIKGTVAKEYLFDYFGLFPSIDYKSPALNDTAKNPVHSKENVTLGESAFMKTSNISKSDYFVKANPADVFMKRARNKMSTNMVDIHKFKNWFEDNTLITPGFVEMTTPDGAARKPKICNKIKEEMLKYIISLFADTPSDFEKTASIDTVKIPIMNKKTNDSADVFKVKKWLESVVSDDLEKAVPTNTVKTTVNNRKSSNMSDVLKVMKWLDIAMSNNFEKIASIDNANLPMNKKKTSDMVDVTKVIKWFESVIPGDSKKIALVNHTKTPNMMELPSTSQNGELSQRESNFVAPEEFPTSNVNVPIYNMKPDFPAVDFEKMVKIIKSMIPEVKGFPGRFVINHHLQEERKARAGTNATVGRTTAF